ncbi:MAG: transposase [Opitutaceae bacterium]|nr:transposase [Opitutaceae bacterium]
MKFTLRKPLPHEVPAWVKTGSLYFVTQCAIPVGTRSLVEPATADALLQSVRYYHEHQRWFARLFLLMPDHLHALISFPGDVAIRECWRGWKRYTAKVSGVEWQRDFFEHRIRSDESWEEKAAYIRENPIRQGLVSEAKSWPWVFES